MCWQLQKKYYLWRASWPQKFVGMVKGRYLAMCVVCYVLGNFLGAFLTLAPEIYFIVAIIISVIANLFRNNIFLGLSMAFLGATSVQVGRIPQPSSIIGLRLFAEGLKTEFSNYLETIIPAGDELAIIKALAIGDKSDVSQDIMDDYKASGSIHLLALSGLHVGIIYKILTIILKPLGGFKISKIIKTIIVLSSMWCFALISGLSASISRAVIMITFYELSYYTHSDRDGLTILSISALFIMLVNPESPREIGFQLSFVAMLSIFIILPRLKIILDAKTKLLQYVWGILAISISCQLTTGIISFLYFGTFPSFFMITNLISMPLITIIMYLIVGTVATSNIPNVGNLFVLLLQKAVEFMNKIMAIIGDL